MFGFGHLITISFTYLISYFLTYLLTYFLSTNLRTLIPTYICTYVLTSRTYIYTIRPCLQVRLFLRFSSTYYLFIKKSNKIQESSLNSLPQQIKMKIKSPWSMKWLKNRFTLPKDDFTKKKVFWLYSLVVEDFLINKLSIFLHYFISKESVDIQVKKIESHSPQNARSFLHGWAKKNRIEIGIVILKKNKTTFII